MRVPSIAVCFTGSALGYSLCVPQPGEDVCRESSGRNGNIVWRHVSNYSIGFHPVHRFRPNGQLPAICKGEGLHAKVSQTLTAQNRHTGCVAWSPKYQHVERNIFCLIQGLFTEICVCLSGIEELFSSYFKVGMHCRMSLFMWWWVFWYMFALHAYRFHAISLGQGQGPVAEKLIATATKSGDWVFLQVCRVVPGFNRDFCSLWILQCIMVEALTLWWLLDCFVFFVLFFAAVNVSFQVHVMWPCKRINGTGWDGFKKCLGFVWGVMLLTLTFVTCHCKIKDDHADVCSAWQFLVRDMILLAGFIENHCCASNIHFWACMSAPVGFVYLKLSLLPKWDCINVTASSFSVPIQKWWCRTATWQHHGCWLWRIWSKHSQHLARRSIKTSDSSSAQCRPRHSLLVCCRTLSKSPMNHQRVSESDHMRSSNNMSNNNHPLRLCVAVGCKEAYQPVLFGL